MYGDSSIPLEVHLAQAPICYHSEISGPVSILFLCFWDGHTKVGVGGKYRTNPHEVCVDSRNVPHAHTVVNY